MADKLIDYLRVVITPRWYNPAFWLFAIISCALQALNGFFMDLFDSIYECADFYKRNNTAVYDRRSRIWAQKRRNKEADSYER